MEIEDVQKLKAKRMADICSKMTKKEKALPPHSLFKRNLFSE